MYSFILSSDNGQRNQIQETLFVKKKVTPKNEGRPKVITKERQEVRDVSSKSKSKT